MEFPIQILTKFGPHFKQVIEHFAQREWRSSLRTAEARQAKTQPFKLLGELL